ncbi:mitochondrial import inner membrane translocase subunit TIM17-2-like [Papaver somniferum]|uniref:mitochondrial import inner membrane translocase subunit TIM17-2-like n=1 Tax=Papaver somniferum TaxID=3469 RepID=UPI000E6FA7EB|nr:mitochondrial import inner membrane translocase subunit TIM17-2-like [Papaver somniferum]
MGCTELQDSAVRNYKVEITEPRYDADGNGPCPHKIVNFAGGAFGLGAVGGGVYHFVKGLYNSQRGERLIGGAQAVRLNSPRLGCYFGAWGATVSACECTIAYVRDKEERWNFIIAAAAASGLLDIRKGFLRASRSAVTVGVLRTLTEGG